MMYIIQNIAYFYVPVIAILYYHMSVFTISNSNQQLSIMDLHSMRAYVSSRHKNITRES